MANRSFVGSSSETNANNPPLVPEMATQTSIAETSSRKRRSTVWEIFEYNQTEEKATCKVCKKVYTHKVGNGLGTLSRHASKHPQEGQNIRQSHLSVDTSTGHMGLQKYNSNVAKSKLANWIIDRDLAFTEVEEPTFNEFTTYLRPEWKNVSRHQVRDEAMRLYGECKEMLCAIFASSNCKFGLTYDNWKALTQDYYICVTCHWIDSDWILQKRIIGFKRFEFPHNAAHIAHMINGICRDFQISNKVFCISFDNASNNTAAITSLRQSLNPILDGKFFHNRCACHILNLCIQDGMRNIEETVLKPIRETINFIRTSGPRYQEFKQLCEENGVNFRKFKTECVTRWNSTCDMLASVVPFKQQLLEFANMNNLELDYFTLEQVEPFVEFLSSFKITTEKLSASYFPTTHQLIPQLGKLLKMINRYKTNPYFENICIDMIVKLKKYYDHISFHYSIAFVLDPRAKMCGLEKTIRAIYDVLYDSDPGRIINTEVLNYLREFQIVLQRAFTIYNSEYLASRRTQVQPSDRSTTNIPYTSRYYEDEVFFDVDAPELNADENHSSFDELALYLATQRLRYDPAASFDILHWWKEQSSSYPVVASMARDFLCTPVSTVASESAFSLSARTLEERRSRLAPTTLEMIMCLRDWNRADQRTQDIINSWIHEDDEDDDIPTT